MPNVAEWLSSAAGRLAVVSDTPRLDAEILLAHALGLPRSRLLARLREPLDAPGVEAMVERRLAYEPIAYITGEWEFFGLPFEMNPPILVPRPETEHLVEAVLDNLPGDGGRVLDVGTGSGCVAIAVARNAPNCSVIATDINPAALALAGRNAERNGVSSRIVFRAGDLFAPVAGRSERFDVICSNPPYIAEEDWPRLSPVVRLHEDPQALLSGRDGLAAIRRLVAGASGHLRPGGTLAFEIGLGQHERVRNLLVDNQYDRVAVGEDLAGIPRVVIARKPMG